GDFYPLTPYALGEDAEIAWQFHRDDLESGLVQAFRRARSEAQSISLKLQGLTAKATYCVTNLDLLNEPVLITGDQLMTSGLTVLLPEQPYAALVLYREVAAETGVAGNTSSRENP
ncbi:MAG TPA: GH36 C-terminal domain-containing protein, partial [Lacipirellulaceae bacterium]|nr:GH36 C-terminal domain-containing protein [Lacipirellulaceae bacterium]